MSAAFALNPVVACHSLVSDNVENAQTVRQSPGLRLVEPHQRRMYDKLPVHRQIQGHVQRPDERIPTVWIAAEISLRHAGDDIVNPGFPRIYGSYAEEKQIPSGDESIGNGIFRFSSSMTIVLSVKEFFPTDAICDMSIR